MDVWSVGVIYYQMLYGKRPFGEGLTQHTIYKDGTILNAKQVFLFYVSLVRCFLFWCSNKVEFPQPTDPKVNKVSEEAKDFIRGCLTYDQELRYV